MKCGADPSLIDGEGCSCVHLATQFGHTSIVAYLIAKGQVHLFNAYKTLCGALISSKQKLAKSQPIRILRFRANEVSLWVELLRKMPYHSILCKTGSPNLFLEGRCPAEFSSNRNQTHLKQLIKVGILETSRQVCWGNLELNSAGHRPSRTECGDPCAKESIYRAFCCA